MSSPMKTAENYIDEARELLRKKEAEIGALKAEVSRIRQDNDSAEAIRQEIWGLAAHSPEPPEWLTGKGVKNGARGGPCMIISDMHYGETINSEETGGMNKFNAEIAKARFNRLINNTIDLCFNHMGRAGVAYPGIVACLGGDMIGGDIHEELARTNDRTSQQSVNELTDLLAGGIEQLASKFGRVFLPCVVGNHGRSDRKPTMKGRVYRNYDWSIYANLERYFRKDKHVRLYVPNDADAHFSVFGHRYMLTHGDSLGTKGGDGLIGALGPILRGKLKIGASERSIGNDFDTLLIGHWHQYLPLPGLICNNAIKGWDEYAKLQLRAPYSVPSQALWFTHPEHGITAHWQVYLEGRVPAEKANKVWTQWLV